MLKADPGIETALSTVGAVCWTVQIIPQVIKSYRTKSTLGLSAGLMAVWALASYPFSAYLVSQRLPIPLQVQPHAFGFLCGISWMQCLYYGYGYSKLKASLSFLLFLVVWAGFETGSVYGLWAAERHHIDAPSKVYGYVSAVMIAGALAPQYIEIYRLKQVIGISLTFMTIDILGGVFSFLSLFFRDKIDIAASVSYGLVVVLDGIVVILAFILNPIAKRREQQAAEQAQVTLNMDTPTTTTTSSGKEATETSHAHRTVSRDSIIHEAPQHFKWPENDGRSSTAVQEKHGEELV
ncbi:hypothetical protein BD324DRAFT_648484 [Kockovaella imperatae]|uniref:PQ loop repeat-domain-containing protein n=1 Tax=Kockovaella imperatae TaxID=4999 RepID=A0A1Y1UQW0_9TREE|nr:hypothetical protein BD324DRAFT_648484 [Kockovaella imperatae]ORX39864.1 hypothetical protein BD324DRAFT_648484 [Kockovaella imperatae]